MTVQFTDTDPDFKDFKQLLKDINGTYLKTGWFEHSIQDKRTATSITNSQLAIIHEYGAEKNGKKFIPERPFVRPSFDNNVEDYVVKIDSAIQKTLAAKDKQILRTELRQLAIKQKQDQQQGIRDVTTPQLKSATIKRKKSTKPLIDKAELLRSNDFEIGKE